MSPAALPLGPAVGLLPEPLCSTPGGGISRGHGCWLSCVLGSSCSHKRAGRTVTTDKQQARSLTFAPLTRATNFARSSQGIQLEDPGTGRKHRTDTPNQTVNYERKGGKKKDMCNVLHWSYDGNISHFIILMVTLLLLLAATVQRAFSRPRTAPSRRVSDVKLPTAQGRLWDANQLCQPPNPSFLFPKAYS